jgi:hypothetical protein
MTRTVSGSHATGFGCGAWRVGNGTIGLLLGVGYRIWHGFGYWCRRFASSTIVVKAIVVPLPPYSFIVIHLYHSRCLVVI